MSTPDVMSGKLSPVEGWPIPKELVIKAFQLATNWVSAHVFA